MAIVTRLVAEVDTPALLVNRDQLEANIRRYAAITEKTGVQLRPHMKTHKTLEIADLQLRAGAGGVTTAKLSEAEVFARAGVTDIFVAYPIVGVAKAHRAALIAQSCHLIVGAESEIGIRQLSEAATRAGTTLFVRVEINSGLNRTGVEPAAAEALCHMVLDLPGLQLDGLFTFRGAHFPGSGSLSPEILV